MIFPSSLYQHPDETKNSEVESGVKNTDFEDFELDLDSRTQDEIDTEEIDF